MVLTLTQPDAIADAARVEARQAFLQQHHPQAVITVLPRDASFRSYYRLALSDGGTRLLMDAPPEKETIVPFLKVNALMREAQVRVPETYAADHEQGFLLLEDLGSAKLNQMLQSSPENMWDYYRHALDALVTLQSFSVENIDLPLYDAEPIMAELSIFTEWYLPVLTGEPITKAQQRSFNEIWHQLMPLLTSGFPPVVVHRDYHVDNLMWVEEEECLAMIDFQDALIGSPAYDVLSLLKDARVDVPQEIEAKGITYYLDKVSAFFPAAFDRKAFLAQYALWNVQRNLKILGFIARKAKRDHMPQYQSMLPRTLAHVRAGLKHPLLLPVKEWLAENARDNFGDGV